LQDAGYQAALWGNSPPSGSQLVLPGCCCHICLRRVTSGGHAVGGVALACPVRLGSGL
jgi:hypothetical protein